MKIRRFDLEALPDSDGFFPQRLSINDQALSRGLAKLDDQVKKARAAGNIGATRKDFKKKV
jgi:hypothetical protein